MHGMLDFKTLIAINFIVNIINLLTMASLWRRYGGKYQGLQFWLLQMAAHVLGIGLILMRDALPGVFSTVVANAFLMFSTVWLLMGFERFTGRISSQWHNFVAFGVYLFLLVYYGLFVPDLPARNIAGAAFIVFIDMQTFLLLHRAPPAMRRIMLFPGLVILGYVAASLLRIAILVSFPQSAPVFRSGLADSLVITSYLSLHICLMVSLVMTLTRRLLGEVQAQEEKFAKAFHSAPYAMALARRADGVILEVNKGFGDIFGVSRDEALGNTLAGLGLVAVDAAAPAAPGSGRREASFFRKSGEAMMGQMATEALTVNGEACILTSIADITEEHRLKQQLEELATTDTLTGCPTGAGSTSALPLRNWQLTGSADAWPCFRWIWTGSKPSMTNWGMPPVMPCWWRQRGG